MFTNLLNWACAHTVRSVGNCITELIDIITNVLPIAIALCVLALRFDKLETNPAFDVFFVTVRIGS